MNQTMVDLIIFKMSITKERMNEGAGDRYILIMVSDSVTVNAERKEMKGGSVNPFH